MRVPSPFVLSADKLQILGGTGSPMTIQDNAGLRTGLIDGTVVREIPGSTPIYVRDGSKRPPVGYTFDTGDFSVVLSGSEAHRARAGFFAGNRVFEYDRSGAVPGESDHLFFDGGLSAITPDPEARSVNLLTLSINETDEGMIVIKSLELAQNDSVRLGALESGRATLMSYGRAKQYTVGLEYVSATGRRYFSADSIELVANTSHTFVPDWPNLGTVDLEIIFDLDNDGVSDDTLHVSNDVTGLGHQGSVVVPRTFQLAQNYPNPFAGVTTIMIDLPESGEVALRVFDLLGREVQVFEEGITPAGRHTITLDAGALSAGVYFYRLQAGHFVETKSMIVLK
jgi:hypothetical protein